MPLPTVANTTNPRSQGYHVQIEDTYFQLVSSPERPFDVVGRAGEIPAAREFIRNPEDLTDRELSAPLSQLDFSGGEGLDFAHRPDNTDFDKTRFWGSKSIEVVEGHGTVQKVRLAKQFAAMRTRTDTSTWYGDSQIAFADGSLFVIDNSLAPQRVVRFDDPLNSTVNTGEDPFAGEVAADMFGLAVVDGELYVSISGNGVHKRDSTGVWTHFDDQTPRRMWGLKGRLIGSYLGREFRVLGGASPDTILKTLPVGEEFLAACDAGAAILAGATNGQVYAFADVDGTLTLRAQTPFLNEEIVGLGAGPSGIVLVGTRSRGPNGLKGRLYMGELGSSYTIQNAQLLREWDLTAGIAGHAPSFITFNRDRAYFFVSPSGAEDEIWVFDVTTTGLFRLESRDIANTDFAGAVVVDGRLFFADRARSLYREETTYQTSGYLISPLFDHFDAEDKVWAAAKFFGAAFPAGTSAVLSYSTNPDAIEDSAHASWTSIKTLNAASGVDDAETLIAGASSRWITFKMELSTSNTANTPQVRGYSARAYAGQGDVTLRLPVNCSDVVVRPGRHATPVRGWGDTRYDQLKTYEGTAVTLKWLYTDETYEGTVKQVGFRQPLEPRRGSPLFVAEVEFVGRRV